MMQVNNVSLQFGGRVLFKDVNVTFSKGNCYGIIGANGAGKSTFLRILSNDLEPNSGDVSVDKNERVSILRQNQNAFDEFTLIETVIMGHKRLKEISDEKDALYAKADFSDEDGVRAAELEAEFMDLNGWEAESDAASLLNSLNIDEEYHYQLMKDTDSKIKVKVLLAQALFGNPDILILDEPTNHLDLETKRVLEEALSSYNGTIIFVSHDRFFVDEIANHVFIFNNKNVEIHEGNYSSYRINKEKTKSEEKEIKEEKVKKEKVVKPKNISPLKVEKELTTKQEQLDKLKKEYQDDANCDNYILLEELHEKITKLESEIQELEEIYLSFLE